MKLIHIHNPKAMRCLTYLLPVWLLALLLFPFLFYGHFYLSGDAFQTDYLPVAEGFAFLLSVPPLLGGWALLPVLVRNVSNPWLALLRWLAAITALIILTFYGFCTLFFEGDLFESRFELCLPGIYAAWMSIGLRLGTFFRYRKAIVAGRSAIFLTHY